MTYLELYRKLFVHRADVYAEQHEAGYYMPVGDGHFEGSGADRRFVYDSYTPLDDDALREHLEGFASYGVYGILPKGIAPDGGTYVPHSVTYAVFDLDTYDAQAFDFLTRCVQGLVVKTRGAAPANKPADAYGVYSCLLCEDSGGKGYHLWLFLSEPTSAAKVRAWTEPVRAEYQRMQRTAATPWPALEIFPKQDEVEPGDGPGGYAFGNLVKLPFGVHAKTKARSVVKPLPGWAHELHEVIPLDAALIPDPPPPSAQRTTSARSGDVQAPFACILKILTEGASHAEHNRDSALYHFCRYAVSCGVPGELLHQWAEEVNAGFDPPLTATEVRTKVRSALGAHTANPGCSADWLRHYCPGGPSCYAPWNPRGNAKPADDDAGPWRPKEERVAELRAKMEGK